MNILNFKINHCYTLDEIRNSLGGPLLASIATKNNQILYVKFKKNKKLNPNLPQEIWIQNGPNQIKSAMRWLENSQAVPMFVMDYDKKKRWNYIGLVKPEFFCKYEAAVTYTQNVNITLVLKCESST